jgi:hypothetical protein
LKFVSTVRFAVASAVLLFSWANHAGADLYRWVDPETGSVKFSSYPPPWFGNAAREPRAPKVEHIPAGTPAPAIEGQLPDGQEPPKPLPEAGGKPQAPASSSMEDRRKALLKQISAHAAELSAAKPEESARIYADLAERVREYNSAELFLIKVDAGGEAARRAERNELVAGIEGLRRRMLEQLAAIRLPAQGSPPDSVRVAWLDLGRQVASLGWVENAMKLLDPGGAPVREGEQAALTQKIAQQWKPLLDVILRPPAQ